MSAGRLIVRGARAAARVTTVSSFTKPAVSSIARSFSATAKVRNAADALVQATEVAHSSYTAGKVERQTIPVTEGEQEAVVEPVPEKVVPLTRATYNQMPPQLQKMTLMDKVVIVTGYVSSTSFTFAFKGALANFL
jgi:hypothetical protein